MSKILKAAATVVGAVALVATGVGAVGFGIGLAAAASTVTVAGLGIGTLLAVSAGLSVASGLLAKRPKAPSTSDAVKDRLQVTIDPRTPRKFVFGRTAMATDLRDQEIIGSNQDYVDRFIVVASHAVQSIEVIWFDDKLAWSSGGGVGLDFAGYLTVNTRLEGSAANAINISARMGSSRRYTGLAYVYLRYKLTGNSKKAPSPFQQSIPQRVTIVGKGAKVYDPRLDSTVPGGSGPQRANDQTTWAWSDSASRNPALQLLWYLLGWRIQNPSTGNWRLAVGKGVPPERIDLTSFITAANLCDEPVTLAAGGTEPRYRSDGLFSEADATGTVIEQLKATMNAELDDVDGKLRLLVLHNDLATPIADFSEDDVLDDFTWDQSTSLDDTFNVVRGTYIDPSTNSLYQAVDYPEVRIASPDGIDRIETVDLQLVQSPSQAQRLAKQRVARMLYSGTFTATFGHRAWKVQRCDVVRLSFKALGWTNKLFRVVDTAVQVDGQVPMTLREEHPDIYLWDAEEAPAVAPVAPTTYDPAKDSLYTYVADAAQGASAFTLHNVYGVELTSPKSVKAVDAESTTTSNRWGAAADTLEGFLGGATIAADAGVGTAIGLSADTSYTNPVTHERWYALRYGLHPSGDGNLYRMRSGALTAYGANAPGRLQVTSDGKTVRYYRGGVELASLSHTVDSASETLFGMVVLADNSRSVDEITFAKAGGAGDVPTLATIYKRSATTPALPTTTGTFNPYTNTITGLDNGWTTAVPAANGQPLWISAAPAVIVPPATTDTIAAGEWASPVVDSQDGAAGAGGYQVVTVELYQRNNTNIAPSTPGSTLTFDFTTGVLSGTLGAWSQSDPPASNGKYLFRTIAAALATAPATTDTIASGEWQAAQRIVKDGDNGADGFTVSPASVDFGIACTANGTPKAGEFNKTITFKVLQGSTDLSDDAATTYVASLTGTGWNGSFGGTNNKVLTLTGISADDAAVTVDVKRSGTTIAQVRVSGHKNKDGTSANYGSTTFATMPNATSFTQVGSNIDLTVPNGATMTVNAVAAWLANSGTYPGEIRVSIENLTDGGAPSNSSAAAGDITATTTESANASISAFTMTNSTGAAKTFRARMYARRTSGSGSGSVVSGSGSGMEASVA